MPGETPNRQADLGQACRWMFERRQGDLIGKHAIGMRCRGLGQHHRGGSLRRQAPPRPLQQARRILGLDRAAHPLLESRKCPWDFPLPSVIAPERR